MPTPASPLGNSSSECQAALAAFKRDTVIPLETAVSGCHNDLESCRLKIKDLNELKKKMSDKLFACQKQAQTIESQQGTPALNYLAYTAAFVIGFGLASKGSHGKSS